MSNKKLTPEEMTALSPLPQEFIKIIFDESKKLHGPGYFVSSLFPERMCVAAAKKCMEYAAQEVAEKDALLKEAIDLLIYWRYDYNRNSILDIKVDKFLNKVSGRGAAEDADH